MSEPRGYCTFVLHTHLPYVHHPDYPDFLEEDWLFEAMTETYLPLLLVMENLSRDEVPFRLAFTMTPPLIHMLQTPDLMEKFERYLQKRIELSRLEVERGYENDLEARTANHYQRRFKEVRDSYDRYQGRILDGFKHFAESGQIEILASAATHGFLPLIDEEAAVAAQIRLGVELYRNTFGHGPRGFWLPECAYRPGLDQHVKDAGVEYVILDTHGLTSANPSPPHGSFRPITLPAGVVAFGRDAECSQQVWSSEVGYPGDPDYRELYRDLGYHADYRYIRPFLKPDGVRRNVGLKYHRITGDVGLHDKQLYDPDRALERAREHAGNFLFNRSEQIKHQRDRMGEAPVIVAPFDTELFGHWWYEGPSFLEACFRQAHDQRGDLPFQFMLPREVMDSGGSRPDVYAHHCTWGASGFSHVWLNDANQWFWPHLHEMERRMVARAREHAAGASNVQTRLLDQMARELLLAESSDWLFIVTQKTAAHYAERRVRDHIHRFFALEDALDGKPFEEAELARVETHDAIFADLDFRVYAPSGGA